MKVTFARIFECVQEVFSEVESADFSPAATLGQLPEWDSMAAVNLQTSLMQQFDREVPLELLSDETTFEELADFLNGAFAGEAVLQGALHS